MNLVFVSNYFNHHQQPVSQQLYELCKKAGGSYFFIQTEQMEEERVAMGWGDILQRAVYVRNYGENPEDCQRLIDEADAVIFGGTEDERFIQTRLEQKMPVWRYSERLYKEGRYRFITPRGLRKKFLDHTRHNGERVYLLCSGAYVAGDFRMVAAYPFKKFRYGYFPEHIVCDANQLIAGKYMDSLTGEETPVSPGTDGNTGCEMTIELLWAARMIGWKHPERAVLMTEALLKDGLPVHLTMAGGGPLETEVRALIAQKGLTEKIDLVGFQNPQAVRALMRKSHIYLAVSDRMEGWGAVINEAMDSGCLVVADRAMGAAPYLIRSGENGLSYPTGRTDAAVKELKNLLREPEYEKMRRMQRTAYETIDQLWNADVAAERLYRCIDAELCGEKIPEYEEGPLSRV
ncbi:MAG: glycosyltransferase family 4 protein [Lachnospiraceae bacterium]|nr:glycosyltransferase family 4 protein [Lachnospiraceae bacterium]